MRANTLDERQRRQLIATTTVRSASNATTAIGMIEPLMVSIDGNGEDALPSGYDNLTQAVNAALAGGGAGGGGIDGGAPDRVLGGTVAIDGGTPADR